MRLSKFLAYCTTVLIITVIAGCTFVFLVVQVSQLSGYAIGLGFKEHTYKIRCVNDNE